MTRAAIALALVLAPLAPVRASAAECRRTVVLTVPGVTWSDVERYRPPAILQAAEDGAVGAMSVRTIRSRTTLASGFATISAGARVEAGDAAGGPAFPYRDDGTFQRDVRVAGLDDMRAVLDQAGYGTVEPGALASALPHPLVAIGNADLGSPPPVVLGYGRWPLLAAMDRTATVAVAATGEELIDGEGYDARTDQEAITSAVDESLDMDCASLVVDHGDLARVDFLEKLRGEELVQARRDALEGADALLAHVRTRVEPDDLVMVLSPTSPDRDDNVHFGIAIAVGPGFPAGTTLQSASTQRPGIVTLPDVAPTVLEHAGAARPASMIGRPWFAVPAHADDRISALVELDQESVFVDNARTPAATAYVIFQLVVFPLIAFMLWKHKPFAGTKLGRGLELASLAVVAFPVATNLMAPLPQEDLGPIGFGTVLVAIDVALVTLAALLAAKPLDRLLILTLLTTFILLTDTVLGAHLQLNTVFSYSPIVAGRFAGVGNLVFSTLGISTLIAATLIVHRWNASAISLWAAAGLFVATIAIDGLPMFGADVGGILALVPTYAIAWIMLSGRRITFKTSLLVVAAGILAFAAFLAVDLARPPEARTHLARLYEDVRAQGPEVFLNTVDRKLSANFRIFRSTIWTYLVPPAMVLVVLIVFNPGGRWKLIRERYPQLRDGLIAGLLLAVIGFAVNDSGIVITALMLAFLVPLALLVHISIERGVDEPPSRARAPALHV